MKFFVGLAQHRMLDFFRVKKSRIKMRILSEISAMQNIPELRKKDQTFLLSFDKKIRSGDYDNVFATALKDGITFFAITETLAIAGPVVIIASGVFSFFTIGVLSGLIYILAPIPGWLYINIKYKKFFINNWKTLIISFIGTSIPLLGSGTIFPLSFQYQTNGEFCYFYSLVASRQNLKNKTSIPQRLINTLIYRFRQ